jgi:hypothetical protein
VNEDLPQPKVEAHYRWKSILHELVYHITMGIACKPNVSPPTPLTIAVEQLEYSQVQLLDHSAKCEFHGGMVTMLEKRISRLRKDISRLTAESRKSSFAASLSQPPEGS